MTNLKLALIEANGKYVAETSKEIVTLSPYTDWSEQNPQNWLDCLQSCNKDLRTLTNYKDKDISGISITAGTHISVLCDKEGNALRPAITWRDQRAAKEVETLTHYREKILSLTLHEPNATWSLAHLAWCKENEPEILENTALFLPAKDWLRYHLTGEIATDFSDAIGTQLCNAEKRDWSKDLCSLASISTSILPEIRSSFDKGGYIHQKAFNRFHLPQHCPVYIGAIDTSTELISANVIHSGQACFKLASAGVVSLCHDNIGRHPPISCYPHISGTGWYFASGMNSCSTAYDWVRQVLLSNISFTEMETLARSSNIGAKGVLFHPFLWGERAPYWDNTLTASFTGLTHHTERSDIARAAYEAIGYALYDIRQNMQEKTNLKIESASLIGGGSSSTLLGQMMADIQNIPFSVPKHSSAAYGAALFAATAHGCFSSLQEATQKIEQQHQYVPNSSSHKLYQDKFLHYRQIVKNLQ